MNRGVKLLAMTTIANRNRKYNEGWEYRAPRGEVEYETTRNEYNGSDMNYGGVEGRFRDRRGREHYDDGRFAPMRSEMNDPENRRSRRARDGRFASQNTMDDEDEMEDRPMNEGDHMSGMPPRLGLGRASGSDKLTKEMAEEWTKGMENEDGTKGPHWTMDQVKQLMAQRGIQTDPAEFWAVLCSIYSDYFAVFKKHNLNNMDLYVDLAAAWLNDKDAVKNKAAVYFEHVVNH